MVVEGVEGEVLVDALRDVEGRDELEGQAGDDAEGAEVDDGAGEGVVGAVQLGHVAVGGDQGHRGHGGGEVAVRDS